MICFNPASRKQPKMSYIHKRKFAFFIQKQQQQKYTFLSLTVTNCKKCVAIQNICVNFMSSFPTGHVCSCFRRWWVLCVNRKWYLGWKSFKSDLMIVLQWWFFLLDYLEFQCRVLKKIKKGRIEYPVPRLKT